MIFARRVGDLARRQQQVDQCTPAGVVDLDGPVARRVRGPGSARTNGEFTGVLGTRDVDFDSGGPDNRDRSVRPRRPSGSRRGSRSSVVAGTDALAGATTGRVAVWIWRSMTRGRRVASSPASMARCRGRRAAPRREERAASPPIRHARILRNDRVPAASASAESVTAWRVLRAAQRSAIDATNVGSLSTKRMRTARSTVVASASPA